MVTCGTVEVLPEFSSGDVAITDCRTTPQEVIANQGAVETTVTVANNNETTALVDVEFSSAGEAVTESLQIGANSSGSSSVEFTYSSPGSYPIEAVIVSANRGTGR